MQSDFKYVAWDIEANGFKPNKIFCIAITDLVTGDRKMFTPETIAEGCFLLADAEMLVGHYIRGYDCPVIEKLTQGLIKFDKSKIVDTLDMSKALTNNAKHSLKVWGDIFGIPKMESPLFESYSPEMLPYCERDVEITVKLFYHLLEMYLDTGKAFNNHEKLAQYIDAITTHPTV